MSIREIAGDMKSERENSHIATMMSMCRLFYVFLCFIHVYCGRFTVS